jgi:Mce-associated membrane protein
MAADADTPDRELSEIAAMQRSPTSVTPTGEGSWKSTDGIETSTADSEPTAAEGRAEETENYPAAVDDEVDNGSEEAAPAKQGMSHVQLAKLLGVVVAVILAALVGWLGFGTYQSHQAQQQRELFVQVGRQGALNLTTIDWQHADSDVQRILDSATGTFYDDFSKRQQPFIDVVKKAQSKSVGTITEAGLESESGDEAQLLVAVSFKTSNLGAAEQAPRTWRMRISVTKVGDEVKVSNVRFVQ